MIRAVTKGASLSALILRSSIKLQDKDMADQIEKTSFSSYLDFQIAGVNASLKKLDEQIAQLDKRIEHLEQTLKENQYERRT